jgi:hypothetical protein
VRFGKLGNSTRPKNSLDAVLKNSALLKMLFHLQAQSQILLKRRHAWRLMTMLVTSR